MEKTNFWNDTAKCGAILGVVLAASSVLETTMTLSGRMGLYLLMLFEWIAVVVLHYYLLHRYTRRYGQLFSADEGFSFGQGYAFLLVVSGFAGILVGFVQYLHLHMVMGYENYKMQVVDAITTMLARNGGVPASMEGIIAQSVRQMQDMPEPSVFATVGGGIFMTLLFGAVFGLIIAGVLSRRSKPFGGEQNQ